MRPGDRNLSNGYAARVSLQLQLTVPRSQHHPPQIVFLVPPVPLSHIGFLGSPPPLPPLTPARPPSMRATQSSPVRIILRHETAYPGRAPVSRPRARSALWRAPRACSICPTDLSQDHHLLRGGGQTHSMRCWSPGCVGRLNAVAFLTKTGILLWRRLNIYHSPGQ
ncbi:hypothetical protein BC628DRAFT_573145 [Trametes gibbosa]|nr:hypothetical protein BC628DRAFT_573145 [Trametes gibbosa]